MLSVGKVGPANAGYYEESVARGMEDYYAGEGEAVGRWVGAAGLVDRVGGVEVSEAEAKLLLEAGCGPDGGQLRRTEIAERSVTAFDSTFSAPKSVSVLYAVADIDTVESVLEAQTAAVEAAVEYLQAHACFTRVGKAGAAVVDGDGLFGIRYRHRTSRAMAPQLHDHCLLANAVRAVDGRWRTLDARVLYRQAKAAGMVYQACLRAELTRRLGVEWGPVSEHGQADIVGVDDRLIDRWSARGSDIEAELASWVAEFEEREGRLPSRAEVGKAHKKITLVTREAKSDDAAADDETLRGRWMSEAVEVGVDVDAMLADVLARRVEVVATAGPTVEAVLDAVEIRHAEWGPAHVVEEIARRVHGSTAAEVLAEVERARGAVFADPRVVELAQAETHLPPADVAMWTNRVSDGRPVWVEPSAVRYSTSTHLTIEQDIYEWATTKTRWRTPMLSGRVSGKGLDPGQRRALAGLISGGWNVAVVVGPAGAGKTTMLAKAREVWESGGLQVFGVAPSARAADELANGAGITTDTLAKLLEEHKQGRPGSQWDFPDRSIVVVDEAAMVATRDLWALSRLALQKEWRVVLVGDHHQLDAIDAGGMFAELAVTADVTKWELDGIWRFAADWEKTASLALRDRDVDVAGIYEAQHRLHGYQTDRDGLDVVADIGYHAVHQQRDTLIMAQSRDLVARLNETITARLLADGTLDPARAIDIDGDRWYPGQRVITRSNDRSLRYNNDDSGRRTLWVRNGDRWIIVGAGVNGGLILDNGRGGRVRLDDDYITGNLEHGYATTIHRAQGATVDEAHTIVTERTSSDALYVAMTRGRNGNHAHIIRPVVDLDTHHDRPTHTPWQPVDTITAILEHDDRGNVAALTRRRELRAVHATPDEQTRRHEATKTGLRLYQPPKRDPAADRAKAHREQMERHQRDINNRRGPGLGRG